jgi:hypothetical protein
MGRADVIICGHSHRPFAKELDGWFFINPGSVGRSDDGDARASYSILEIKHSSFQVQHFRIDYDIEKAVAGLKLHKLPDEFARMVVQGKTLDEILGGGRGSGKAAQKVRRERLRAVLALAKKCSYESDHALQVTRVALMLFDELRPLHGLGAGERFLLECGALLHDVGWCRGREKHHKSSYRMVMKEKLPFDKNEKRMVALIARYHRKTLPDRRSDYFSCLPAAAQKTVTALASMLRVADGLDRSHDSLVQSLACKVSMKNIFITCLTSGPAEWEAGAGMKKGDLMERFFKKKLVIETRQI